MLTITCLLLASKYDELDEKIPFIDDLISFKYSGFENH